MLVSASWTMRKAARSVPGGSGGRVALRLHLDASAPRPRPAPPVRAAGPGRGRVRAARRPGVRSVSSTWRTSPSASLLAALMVVSAVRACSGSLVEQREADARLHVDDRDAVGEDVVQFAGDPQPLLVGAAPFRRGPLGPLAGPLLPAYADQFGGGERRPATQAATTDLLPPGRRAGRPAGGSQRYSQCATSRCPAHSAPSAPRRPGGARRRPRRSRRRRR